MIALGIDIAEKHAVLVLLSRSGKTLEVLQHWSVDAATEEELAQEISRSIERQSATQPDAVATTLPGRTVSHRFLDLPFTEASRLRATIPFELEAEVPLELEESVVAYEALSRGQQSTRVLAAIARNDDVGTQLERLAAAGIDPNVVTLGNLALARLVKDGEFLLIDARRDGGVALLTNGQIARFHSLGGATPAEIRQELAWAADAVRGEKTTTVILTGDPEILAGVNDEIGLPQIPLQEVLPKWTSELPESALRAAALAAEAAQASPAQLNFRTGKFSYHAPSEEFQKQLRLTAWIAAGAILTMLASWGVVVAERNSELNALRAEIRQQSKEIVPRAPRGAEVRRVRGALDELERKTAMLGGAGAGRARTLDLLLAIHDAIPAETPLEVVDLTIDTTGVRFRGRTDTFEAVDVVSRALESLPAFTEANVRDVKAGVDGRIEFRAALESEGTP